MSTVGRLFTGTKVEEGNDSDEIVISQEHANAKVRGLQLLYRRVLRTVYVLCCDFPIDLTKINTGIFLFEYLQQF